MTYTELYAENFLGKVFYFCLKKTGDSLEAEELSADITLSVLEQLSRTQPSFLSEESFKAWIFTIARRRFARWCGLRTRERTYRVFGDDLPEPSSDESIEDRVIISEEYSLLRRELAFIAREHRELIVAHYIRGCTVSELSAELGIPSGTVKTRLMKARKLISEGMNMAREFGKRSYNPDTLRFTASGNQPDGLPWSAVDRKIPVNILCTAVNPTTASELAIELGIALPYMEDEIERLVDATLLKNLGGKPENYYVTNFFIASADTQVQIHETSRSGSSERAELMHEAIMQVKDELYELIKPSVSDEDFMWLMHIMMTDSALHRIGVSADAGFKRPNGGNWGFMGYETHDRIKNHYFVDHTGSWGEMGELWRYTARGYGLNTHSIDHLDMLLLVDMLGNDRPVSSVSLNEKMSFDSVCAHYAHVEGDRLVPDVVVFKHGMVKKSADMVLSTEPGKKFIALLTKLFTDVQSILEKCTSPVLHETLAFYASAFMYDTRGMVVADCVKSGKLTVPADPAHSEVGTYLIVR